MKSVNNFYRYTITFALIAIFSNSCKKFVRIGPPINQAVSETVFSDDQSAISAAVGLYSQMMSSSLYFTNGGLSVFCGLSADEIYNTSSSVTYDPFFKNAISPNETTTNFNRFWARAYSFIYQANAVIEGLQKSNTIGISVKQQLTGEMKFARALCYFYLTNIYGDVPLETTTNYVTNSTMARAQSSLVYDQIRSDLIDAENSLTDSYVTEGRVRPNKFTASALLARVYLYQKDWADAELESSSVINSGIYSLLNTSELENVFKAGSNETIWELMSVSTYSNTAEGNTFIPFSNTIKPLLALTPYLMNSFEPGDQRSVPGIWIESDSVDGTKYYYPFKYKIRAMPLGLENNIVFRLAEQYLIRAEARAQQNNLTDAEADLNIIRNRAGLSDIVSSSQLTLLNAIQHERKVEFFAEWGHRWFDLKRTQTADAILGPIKGSDWQSTDVLYPVPSSEIQSNPNLIQNPGY